VLCVVVGVLCVGLFVFCFVLLFLRAGQGFQKAGNRG
jgi:hypothetical protein